MSNPHDVTGPFTPQLRISPPQPQSALIIGDAMRIESEQPRPNRWRRFWYWALLGWRWEEL